MFYNMSFLTFIVNMFIILNLWHDVTFPFFLKKKVLNYLSELKAAII